jgi:hypothetical protein
VEQPVLQELAEQEVLVELQEHLDFQVQAVIPEMTDLIQEDGVFKE